MKIKAAVCREFARLLSIEEVELASPGAGEMRVKIAACANGINSAREDAALAVRALTDRRGADYVFVTVGLKSVIEQGFGLIRKGGTLVLVGMPASGEIAGFAPLRVADDCQVVLGSKMGSSRIRVDIPKLVDLYQQGRLKLDELITGRYPLEDINEAIASVNRGEALRNVIVF